MSTTSFKYFSRLPVELQVKIWNETIGRPRIHVLRPAPADIFHWNQDFACPIYQAIDMTTNKPLEEDPLGRLKPILTCTFAHEVLCRNLVKGDLSLFRPGVQAGSNIPLTPEAQASIATANAWAHLVEAKYAYFRLVVESFNRDLTSERRLAMRIDSTQHNVATLFEEV
ncbi:hypothetical protein F4803DRAFT_73788 [Xylaria telfairii]|nr:hypothetical protein F4803DRAFT_73788 [Xylaria telfairii]